VKVTGIVDRRSPDGGFTLIESLVSIAVISVLMASLGTYFIGTMKASRKQGQVQTAVRIAQAGMEAARGSGGPSLLVGRAQCGSCLNVSTFDPGYLLYTQQWDAAPAQPVTPTVPLPSGSVLPVPVVVNEIEYYRYFFVGKCWTPDLGGTCGATATATSVPMIRLVVGVTWTEPSCPGAMCIRAATALFSANPSNPLFTQS
jgi:prepilin-type N-terminal cleavage/methylation domain-containing protein